MDFKFLIVASAAAIVLGACATSESNPHYRYSTKYQKPTDQTQPVPTVQSANYQAPISYRDPNAVSAPKQPVFTYDEPATQPYSQTSPQPYVQSAGTVIQTGDSGSFAQPTTQTRTFEVNPISSAPSSVTAPSSDIMIETGGQNAGDGGSRIVDFVPMTQSATAPTPLAQTPATPQTSQQAFTAPTANVAANGIAYIVQESDTAYSLSKRTCSTLADIKQMNGLQADFLIKAGETIRLPASKC